MEIQGYDESHLLGNKLEKFIHKVLPEWFIDWFTNGGNCNCNYRREFLNDVNECWIDYKRKVKLNK